MIGEPEAESGMFAYGLPTLSVLIATCNRAKLLDRTLRSLLEGSATQPDEIIVVNGGSDFTASLLAGLIAKGAPLRTIEVDNVGLSYSKNKGILLCRGDIVATLDDDVVVAPDWAERVKAAHVAYAAAGGIGGRTLNEFPDVRVARFEQARSFEVRGAQCVRPVRTVAGVNMSYKRAVMMQVGLFDEENPASMDVDYNWRVARAGYQILYDPSILLTHRNRTSLSAMLRQQFWYGRGYFRSRRKWPDLPSRTPRGLRGWKNWVKIELLLIDSPYEAIQFTRGSASGRGCLAMVGLALVSDLSFKAGFLREALVTWRNGQ